MNIRRQSGNFWFEEDTFSENVESFSKIYHEDLLLLNFLQTKPEVRIINNNYCDLKQTIIKNRDEKEIVDDENEKKWKLLF